VKSRCATQAARALVAHRALYRDDRSPGLPACGPPLGTTACRAGGPPFGTTTSLDSRSVRNDIGARLAKPDDQRSFGGM
jgi:hypothetical protein